MVVTAQDLRAAGVDIPLFVGGAALTRKFTATRIAAEYGGVTLYAKDAMDGLDLANQLFSAVTREALIDRVRTEQAALAAGVVAIAPARPVTPAAPPAGLPRVEAPAPPDLEHHVAARRAAGPHLPVPEPPDAATASTWGCGGRSRACSRRATPRPSSCAT